MPNAIWLHGSHLVVLNWAGEHKRQTVLVNTNSKLGSRAQAANWADQQKQQVWLAHTKHKIG
jgi:hypothetical protein